jgi:glycosyltransferase involved in cell wall biosynthesis
MGNIGYHPLRIRAIPRLLRSVVTFAYFLKKARDLLQSSGRYDAIVTYGALTTGIAGVIVSKVAKVPLVVDVPGHPFRGLALQGNMTGRVKAAAARRIVPQVLKRAHGVKLLYPTQLADLQLPSKPAVAVFHDFAAVGAFRPSRKDEKYILLLGHPWYLKGVDVLIKAFLRIAERHPGHRLLVVGHCPNRAPFEILAAGNPRIELRKAVFAPEARELVTNCSMLVVASRTEAMGRVILEAFAAEKPVVASRVDGIPFIVQDGQSGLLFESENVGELADCMDRVLSDPALAARLANGGQAAVRERFSEEAFAAHYDAFIREVIAASSPP